MTQTKGERTRERIIAAAAPLFNQQGYVGVSMTDLMAATGLEKGGIYRHFESKDELALAAFDHALAMHRDRIVSYVEAQRSAVAKLGALGDALASGMDNPVVLGGCPLLNTAVECDDASSDTHRALRSRARAGMRSLIGYTSRIIETGIARGELSSSIDAALEGELIIATMEGALMLSRLYDDPRYVRQASDRLRRHAAAMAPAAPRLR